MIFREKARDTDAAFSPVFSTEKSDVALLQLLLSEIIVAKKGRIF